MCGAGAQSALHDKVQLAVDALIDSGALLCEPSCEGASDGPDRGVASEKSGSTVPVLEARLEDGPLTPSLTATPGCSTPRSTAPADLADSAPASARLTKSQRKNLRRAEKKRQKRGAPRPRCARPHRRTPSPGC